MKKIRYTQNFLTSQYILSQISKQVNFTSDDTVYEIGTGKGHLTELISRRCKELKTIELDYKLWKYSKNKLSDRENITFIHQDIMKYAFPNKQSYKIIGNIPYNLSTDIVKKIIFESSANESYLIVEEGFFKRISDRRKKLCLLFSAKVEIDLLLKIPKEHFHPMPKINSVLIKITRHRDLIKEKDWHLYTDFVEHFVRKEFRCLFTKNQFKRALVFGKIKDLNKITYQQFLSLFNSYLLFKGR